MARYAMVIDLRKCVGCQACTAACNAEWGVPDGSARTRVRPTTVAGRYPDLRGGTFVSQCNHCDHPPCIEVCPSGATFASNDGIVRVDRDLCIGCGFCVEACPYGARFIDPVAKKVDKCDFCASRLERGELPACVTTCTAHAKFFGDLEDRDGDVYRMVYVEGARRLETAAVAPGPNVYYLGPPALLEQVAAEFPPHRPRMLAAGEAWRRLARPLVWAAVGAAFLGQAGAFFNQLRKGEADFED